MMLSIISPVYRSKASLVRLYEEVTALVGMLPGLTDYEIILVEDCGGDGSWEVLEELAARDRHVRAVQLSRNFGQHHAITAGMDLCRGDWAVVMDCDLQDRPSDIALLWAKAQEGYDVVNARRQDRKDGLFKRFASFLFHRIFEWLSGLSYDPKVANFRIMHRNVLNAYADMRESVRSLGAQVHWLGFRTGYVDVQHAERAEGSSSYSFAKLLGLAVDTAVSYSIKPLRLSVGIGLSIAATSAAVSLWFFVRSLVWKIPVEGWSSLMVSMWFLGGVIIANLGVIGIYLGKVYDESRRRPIYVIAKRVNC